MWGGKKNNRERLLDVWGKKMRGWGDSSIKNITIIVWYKRKLYLCKKKEAYG